MLLVVRGNSEGSLGDDVERTHLDGFVGDDDGEGSVGVDVVDGAEVVVVELGEGGVAERREGGREEREK